MPTATKVKAKVTVTKFTDRNRPFSVMRERQSLKKFTDLTSQDYAPEGVNTPLRDSTLLFIQTLESYRSDDTVTIGLLLDESSSMSGREEGVIEGANGFVKSMQGVDQIDSEAAGKVMAVIITDGLENASQEVSEDTLSKAIKEKEDEGWTFIYLGANQNAWAAGTSYGLSGTARGQTVSMASSSSEAFANALGTTGRDHGSKFLRSNSAYLATTESSGMSNRVIAEDGTESAAKSSKETDPNVDPNEDKIKSAKTWLSN